MQTQNRAQRFFTPERRRLFSRLWIVAVFAYDAFRAYVISRTLSKYGVNGIWYFIFEMIVSYPYAICSLRIILALVDKNVKKIVIYSSLTALLFFAPDIYLFKVTHHMPRNVYIVYGLVLLLTTTVTVYSLIRDFRKKSTDETSSNEVGE